MLLLILCIGLVIGFVIGVLHIYIYSSKGYIEVDNKKHMCRFRMDKNLVIDDKTNFIVFKILRDCNFRDKDIDYNEGGEIDGKY